MTSFNSHSFSGTVRPMDVVSNCPLLVAGRIWSSARGALTLTIACKATYMLAPGVSQFTADQEPINEDDNYWDDDSARSLYAPNDLAPYKPAADVVLVGYAFAPGHVPVPSFHVRMIVGDVDKSIEVFGDRAWLADGTLAEPARVLRVPLRYERASGGPGTWNPVGIRPDAPDMYGRQFVPNLITPGKTPTQRGDVLEPVGFGPIGPMWPSRMEKLGGYAGSWDYYRWHDRPLPDGFDPTFFNVAPWDQRVGEIRGNERIVLENLHPEHPRLVTNLPGLRPRALVERTSGRRDEVVLVGDTMWIDSERAICTVVWRGRIGLTHPQEAGKVTVTLEEGPRAVAGPEQASSAPPSGTPERRKPTRTLDLMDPAIAARMLEIERQTMPFAKQGAPDAGPPASTPPPRPSSSGGLPFGGTPPSAPPAVPPMAPPPPPRVRPSMPSDTGSLAAPNPPLPPPGWSPATMNPPVPAASKLSIGQRAVAESAAPAPPPAMRDLPTATKSAPAPVNPGTTSSPQLGRLGAVAASDAAALTAAQAAQASIETPAAVSPGKPRTEPRSPAEPFVDLLWFEKTAPKRVRAQANFAADLRDETSGGEWLTLEDTRQPKQEIKDRRDIVRVLRRVAPVDADGVMRALTSAIDEDGALSPPLVVVSGEVQLFFHEVQTLKATIAVASPLASADKRLKETLDAANELVQSDWKCTALAAEGMTNRLREAFVQANRSLPNHFLDQNVERVLLEQRSYQKRMILGEKRLRSAIVPEGSTTAIPCYLSEELEAKLPLFQRFRAAVIAEVRGQQDQYETNPLALVALAVARVLSMATPTGR